jgi:hypothetical protein
MAMVAPGHDEGHDRHRARLAAAVRSTSPDRVVPGARRKVRTSVKADHYDSHAEACSAAGESSLFLFFVLEAGDSVRGARVQP